MGPVHTLHEFALNLLSDSQALADFNADPAGVLSAAGLGDVSAADVHEILPLVMDTAPASVTDSLSSFAATGDVAGTLDHAMAAADAVNGLPNLSLSDLPNLSGVFGAVSDLAEQTGLNVVTDDVLHTTSDVIDGVATAVDNVPIAGPVLNAGAIDLEHTVDAVGAHLYDGELVGSAVDALTNHLGDALMPGAVVDAVSGLPLVGESLGGLANDLRYEGGAVLGTVNEAIGSTPVGEHSGQILAELGNLTDVQSTVAAVTDSVETHAAQLPVVGGAVSGVLTTATDAVGNFDLAGDVSDTLDHVTAALPAAPALPAALPALPAAIPALPALPAAIPAAVPAVGHIAGAVTHTAGAVAGHLPVAGDVVSSVSSSLPDVGHDAVDHVSDVHSATASVTGLVGHAQDLNIGGVADGLDQHAGGLLGDDLHLGH